MTLNDLDFTLSILRPKKGDILICQLPDGQSVTEDIQEQIANRIRAGLDRQGLGEVACFVVPPQCEMKLLPLEAMERGLQQIAEMKRRQKA